MLRSIVGVRYDDFLGNIDVRESLCQSPGSLKLKRARLKWFGHVERMGDERQVKKIMNAEMKRRRPVGRPRTRWKDVIKKKPGEHWPEEETVRVGSIGPWQMGEYRAGLM